MSSPGPSGLNTPSAASPSIVNPLSALDSSHFMAALSSLSRHYGLLNPSSVAGPSRSMDSPAVACRTDALSGLNPSGLVSLPSTPSMSNSIPTPPRTTAWRHKREGQEGKNSRTRKAYTCTVCERPMTSEGHTQFRGQQYCPLAPGQIPQSEWLQKVPTQSDSKLHTTYTLARKSQSY